ncbi:hypothetical protein [Candidatus Contubernalis alkaliaceticus]|uniref:hypothetical protein n=1 Tax=Candidatus Contubernalis alkaliaceticus TaxID=338645 RepID=UPI001F4C4A5E|nr:hypothetical protein [Candidatus Contubernalis alkalaceticus]UNC91227.1 hypothetical protein HUE98_03460 [Candidatus Contubernalis alkalaceticus]
MFFSVYEDLAHEYVNLMEEIMDGAETMDTEDKLYHIFQEYITYYMKTDQLQPS